MFQRHVHKQFDYCVQDRKVALTPNMQSKARRSRKSFFFCLVFELIVMFSETLCDVELQSAAKIIQRTPQMVFVKSRMRHIHGNCVITCLITVILSFGKSHLEYNSALLQSRRFPQTSQLKSWISKFSVCVQAACWCLLAHATKCQGGIFAKEWGFHL